MGFGDRLRDANAKAKEISEKAKADRAEMKDKLADLRRESAEKMAERGGIDIEGAIFVGQSHDEGRNATVALYPDRIERVKPKKFSAFSNTHQDVEMTPVRAVSSVQAKRDGMLWTKVTVYASGNNIDFRFSHDEAARFKDALQRLMLQGSTPVIPAPAAPDMAEQLQKLAGLRDQGILTEDEFTAQKAKILGL